MLVRVAQKLGLLALCTVVVAGCGSSSPPLRTEGAVEESVPPSRHFRDSTVGAADFLEAALAGQTERVRSALDRGIDPSTAGSDGRTALMLTTFDGHSETARLLLERGARVGDRDGAGRTALMYAASGPNDETVRLLLAWKANPLDVDHEERFTALMFAAEEGQADVVRTLLRHGSDPGLVDVDGDSALDFATRNGHEAVVRLLSDR